MSSTQERMRELVRRLNETAYAYYVLDNPVISDMPFEYLRMKPNLYPFSTRNLYAAVFSNEFFIGEKSRASPV